MTAAAADLPMPGVPAAVYSLFVFVLFLTLVCRGTLVWYRAYPLATLYTALETPERRRVVHVRGIGAQLLAFERTTRNHFRALMLARSTAVPTTVPVVASAARVRAGTLRATAADAAGEVGVAFDLTVGAPAAVQLLWGVPARDAVAAVSEAPAAAKARRAAAAPRVVAVGATAPEFELVELSPAGGRTAGGGDGGGLLHGAAARAQRALASTCWRASALRSVEPAGAAFASSAERAERLPSPLPRWSDACWPLVVATYPRARAPSPEALASAQLSFYDFNAAGNDGAGKFVPGPVVYVTRDGVVAQHEIFGSDDAVGEFGGGGGSASGAAENGSGGGGGSGNGSGAHSEETECIICLCEPMTVMLLPCRHLCCCADCYKHLDRCPVCRSAFSSHIRLVDDLEWAAEVHGGTGNGGILPA